MAKEYAIKDKNAGIIYQSDAFKAEADHDVISLSDTLELWVTKEDALQSTIEDLKVQLQEEKEANLAKEAFLSNMSHDIRTPMNAIIGMTAIAQKHIDEKSRVLDSLDKISIASSHLLSLINEVLDMSRINSGRMKINAEITSLSDLIHDTLTIVNPQAAAKKHTMTYDFHDILYENVSVDALRLRQIYVNIINNAIKYTNDKGHITLSIYEEFRNSQLWLNFVCRDNGIGMSEEFLGRLFTPFERAASTTISKIEGTGLGMSIVKKLVENMNGTIKVDSVLDQGTTVTIELPVDYEIESINTDALQNKHILILEDNREICKNYADYLGSLHVPYDIVTSSAEAITLLSEDAYSENPYAAVILGSSYESSGTIFDLATYMKKAREDILIILVSNDNWEEIEYRANRSGIDRFIPLPFFRKSLINGLNEALSLHSTSMEEHSGVDLSGKKILLVEDNMINMMIAKELLKVTNAEIITAENGQDALDRYLSSEENYFDLVLMDIQMPVMDGYNATKLIRTSKRNDAKTIKIYAMSANTFAEDIAKSKEAGMDGHIAKPIDVKKLMNTLRKAF